MQQKLIASRTIRNTAIGATVVVVLVLGLALVAGQVSSLGELMSIVATVVLIWTAAVGAENLLEIRRARLADFEPILVPKLPELIHPFDDNDLEVGIRNIGRGTAREIEVTVWRPEGAESNDWYPTTVSRLADLIEPSDELLVEFPISHRSLWMGEVGATYAKPDWEGAQLIVELKYLDPLDRMETRHFTYAEAQRPDSEHTLLTRVDVPLPDLKHGDRARTVRLQLRAMTTDSNLPDWELTLSKDRCRLRLVDVTGGPIQIQVGANDPAEQIAIRLYQALCRHEISGKEGHAGAETADG